MKKSLLKPRMSKEDLRHLAEGVYEAILRGEPAGFRYFFSAVRCGDLYGFVDWEVQEVVFNPRKPMNSLINTYVHESLHVWFPERNENSIRRLANKLVRVLTRDEKEVLFKYITARLDWDD